MSPIRFMYKNSSITVQYLILIILIYFVVFLKLGYFSMRWWDESMFAVNTYEMRKNGKWFSLYLNHSPDIYNSKPPLTSWMQIIFVKILGYNELAVRLPSATAAALSILILFKFVSKHFNYIWAWVSALILLTSSGFINFHSARTAEADSLLTLFLLIANIYFARYILYKTKRDILLFFIFIMLAFSTKLYAAFLFTPAYLFLLIYKRLFNKFVFNGYFLAGLLILIFSAGSLIYLREVDTPGYINEILFKDAGRIFKIVENHKEYALFYIDRLSKTRFSIWFVFFVLGTIMTFFSTKEKDRTILFVFLSYITSYLLIISISVTKLEWYYMPLYPFLSLVSAYPIYSIIKNIRVKGRHLSGLMTYSILVILFIQPYWIIFKKSQANNFDPGEKVLQAKEIYLFKRSGENKNLNGIKIFYQGWKASLLFYQYKLAEKQEKIELIKNINQISINDTVLVSDENLRKALLKRFDLSLIDKINNAELIKIGQKQVKIKK